jgi:hypothetical protein
MQTEVELQIAAVIREVDGNNTLGASALAERIATTLLSRFVLCNAEPVAWQYQVNYTYCNVSWVLPPEDSYDEGTLRPLYAPADIGKEGGE